MPSVPTISPRLDRAGCPRPAKTLPSAALWAVVGLFMLASCAGPGRIKGSSSDLPRPTGNLDQDLVQPQIDAIGSDLQNGAAWAAARRAAALRRSQVLSPDDRDVVEGLLEVSLETAAAVTDDSDIFDAFDDRELSRRAKAILVIGEARALLGEDEPNEAFMAVRRFEKQSPGHHLRSEAGDIIYEAGIRLSTSKKRTLFFFKKSGYAPQILEYLVLNHPSHPACGDAYATLANIYEKNGSTELAIARYEDLLLYHPKNSEAPRAEATIPRLRLGLHLRDDYDRNSLKRARRELEQWLARYAQSGIDPSMLAQVQDDLADCLGRLVHNDLIVSRFYRRVDEPYGARLHALRALGLSREVGAQDYTTQAEELIAWADAELAERNLPAPAEAESEALATENPDLEP
ncbi:hypothetical protein [Engelhardtia mirabilis]|uniref:Uncharacterized protein n=1 Tax=Engelhardtia mirabilis TaxID=2528011 RepID=A0A518BNI5_9BACT|nr:hypothetical protein Pla133_36140 [Planctomycetes bacterium Pla133]QDV02841.1 hypothetical protein Pla86_36120 [Planctomycetes bacterium Pla86]